jgi:UDP-glucose 4-epimerase
MTGPLTWVVGRGGLLGRHVATALCGGEIGSAWRPPGPTDWTDEHAAASTLGDQAIELLDQAERSGCSWRVLWCAGAGVVATSAESLEQETRVVARVHDRLAARLGGDRELGRRGTLFHASSAGGAYAASLAAPPYDESSPVLALAPYGREKLAQEAMFERMADECAADVLIGRLSNLYGPGQRLDKPQGLISHVGRAALRREPIPIYVPLDTIRDYLFVEDAGRMVASAIERFEGERLPRGDARVVVKIFASEVPTTVASVLGAWRQALRRPLRIAMGGSSAGHLQPRVLSFRSRVWPDLRGCPTLLSLGIDAVRRDQLARLLAAGLA